MFKVVATSLIAVNAEPIITFDQTIAMATSSGSLVYDFVRYGNDKFTEALPKEYSLKYKQVIVDQKAYWQKYITPVIEAVKDKYHAHSGYFINTLGLVYGHMENFINQLINPVIREFELKHPAQAGLIGESLADRITLIAWLTVLLVAVKRILFR